MASRHERHSPREARHLEYISQFTTDLRHISGTDNVTADALSRIEISTVSSLPTINYEDMAVAQTNETPDLPPNTSLQLQWLRLPNMQSKLLCDISTGTIRPFVPTSFRKPVFLSLHSLSHPGILTTQKLITSRFVWPNVNTDVNKWTRECLSCQRSKVQRHTKAPLHTFLPPGERFEKIHLDIVGPLPPSDGFRYILTIIDRFTRWTEAIPLTVITAESVAKAFLTHWISRFGIPLSCTSDQGKQFTSHLWRDILRLLGIEKIHSTAYHPISQGIIERFHRQLKASLSAHPHPESWTDALPLVMLGIRTAIKEDLQCSPAELVYGSTLRLPGEFFSSSTPSPFADPLSYLTRLRRCAASWRPTPTRVQKVHSYVPKDLSSCTHVFVRHDSHRSSLQPKYDGPFKVISRKEKFFTIQRPTRTEVVSIDRLKPAFVESNSLSDTEFDSRSDSSTISIPISSSHLPSGTLPNLSTTSNTPSLRATTAPTHAQPQPTDAQPQPTRVQPHLTRAQPQPTPPLPPSTMSLENPPLSASPSLTPAESTVIPQVERTFFPSCPTPENSDFTLSPDLLPFPPSEQPNSDSSASSSSSVPTTPPTTTITPSLPSNTQQPPAASSSSSSLPSSSTPRSILVSSNTPRTSRSGRRIRWPSRFLC